MPFYAVARGRRPGVYTSWDDTKIQVEGFTNARHKKFPTEKAALEFIAAENCAANISNQNEAAARSDDRATGHGPVDEQQPATATLPLPPRHYKFYAVAKGRVSGVYTTWKEADEQIKGMYSAKYKGFLTLEDAQLYIDHYKRSQQADPSDPHPADSSTLVAFTDGSALNNGTPFCRAGWACVFPHNTDWHRAEPLAGWRQTNNRAEYRAAIEAIKRANEEDPAKVKPLYIYSDSMLLKRSMTEWVPDWIEQGWAKADGKPVMNSDLLKWLLKEQGERRIIWKHVRAHTNGRDWQSKWNDLADQMAKEQARNDFSLKRGRYTAERESGTGGGCSSFKRGRYNSNGITVQSVVCGGIDGY